MLSAKPLLSPVLGNAGLFDDKAKLNGYRVKGFHCRAKVVIEMTLKTAWARADVYIMPISVC